MIFLGQDIIFLGREKGRAGVFIMQIATPSSSGGRGGVREGPGGTDDLVGADQKMPDWLITFLVKVETAVRLVLNLGLVLWALAQVTPYLGLWFFSLAIIFVHVIELVG